MSDYRCPSCGSNDPWLYIRCQRTGCPDGRDPRPSPVMVEIARLRAENERLTAERDNWKSQCLKAEFDHGELSRLTDKFKARALAAEAREAKAVERHLEYDEGRITYRDGDLSITAFVSEVTVYRAGSGEPASAIKPENLGSFLRALPTEVQNG